MTITTFTAADASEANGLRNLKCRDPLKWILFAALMNFGSKRESLTAEIRNFTIRQNRHCKKQTNKPSQNRRVNAAWAASKRVKNLGHQSILRAIRNVIHLLLSKSLAEEENADQLLNQIARSLMSVAKMPAVIEQVTIDEAE